MSFISRPLIHLCPHVHRTFPMSCFDLAPAKVGDTSRMCRPHVLIQISYVSHLSTGQLVSDRPGVCLTCTNRVAHSFILEFLLNVVATVLGSVDTTENQKKPKSYAFLKARNEWQGNH